jgi:hypothetical protein
MAKDKMNNPYEEEFDEETFTISRRAMWWMVIAFVLVCLNPPLWRNVFEATKGEDGWVPVTEFFKKAPDEKLTDHLKKYEKELDDADFTKWPRREMQKGITAVFGAGNRKAVIGKDGWVYFQPALDGLTGYGPVTPEPDSVAKDPNREAWNGPTEVIKRFAEQLRGFGVELVLVPVPVKPMIYPEGLTGKAAPGPAMHPDAAKFYASLENVTVVDLADDLWMLKETEQVFLKQDTHWTPEGMEFVAKKIAAELRGRAWFTNAGSDPSRYELLPPEERSAIGDLVEKLGVLPTIDGYVPQAGFGLESVKVQRVIDTQSGKAPVPDVESKVVLLGDSFVNIYSAEGDLHWGTGAGFGEHLAKELGMSVDVIAINGQAATGVRERLASRPNSAGMMKEKKIVVWAVAARDLFMSESTARSNDVKWEDVAFNDQGEILKNAVESGDVTVVEAEMTLRSVIPDPQAVVYNDALYGAEYAVKKVVSGSAEIAEGETLNVVHWGFEEKVMSPESKYEVGDLRTLHLVDFATKAELQQTQLENEAGFAPTIWFDEGEKTEVVAAPVEGSVATANAVCVIVSLLVVVGLLSVGRRKS